MMNGRAWLRVGLTALVLIAVLAACEALLLPPTPQEPGGRGPIARDAPTSTNTAIAELISPANADPPEGWSAEKDFGAGEFTRDTGDKIEGASSWQYNLGGLTNPWVRWDIPAAAQTVFPEGNTSIEAHLAIKMIETPTDLSSIWDPGISGPYLVYDPATGEYVFYNNLGYVAAWRWTMSNNAWHTIDYHADSNPIDEEWLVVTPLPGRLAGQLWIDRTPQPTPTPVDNGEWNSWAPWAPDTGWTQLYQGSSAGSGKLNIDDVRITLRDCADGICARTELDTVTPTPSLTPTPSRTPTPTRTPRPTATATITATAWGPDVWICPTAVMTVDAQLADWAAITNTITLNGANAAFIWPAATPSAADLSADFRCAHSSTLLYVSGTITDSVLTQDSAPIDDDAVTLGIDGWGDGFLRLRGDDHDLVLAQDGRLRDFETLPISATLATTTTVAGWQFELSVPRTTLELQTLSRRLIKLQFGLIDDDDGGLADQRMIAPTRAAGMD